MFTNFKQEIQIGFLSLINILIAFYIQSYTFKCLGPGVETDALFASMTAPQLVISIVCGSLMNVLVPILSCEDEDGFYNIVWLTIFIVGGLFIVLALLLLTLAPWWVSLTVPGFTDGGKILTLELTKFQLVTMVLTAVNTIQISALQSRNRFIYIELVIAINSFISFLIISFTLPIYGVFSVVWVISFRAIIQTLLFSIFIKKVPVWSDMNIKKITKVWFKVKPLIIGSLLYKTDPFFERYLLSSANSGSISLYFFAQQIYGAGSQIIDKVIASPLVPRLSKLINDKKMKDFHLIYYWKLFEILLISLLIILMIIFFGIEILNLLVLKDSFNTNKLNELWYIIIWLSGTFVFGNLSQITTSAFFTTGDTKTPSKIGIYTFFIYIPLKIISFYMFGVMGLALSTSFFVLINFLFQFFIFRNSVVDANGNFEVAP